MVTNPTQLLILKNLMFKKSSSYSEIQPEGTDHDLFNYHLKELMSKGFIEKIGSDYELSQKGRNLVSLMEEDSSLQKQFKVGVYISMTRKNTEGNYELLLYRRLKHPHYGIVGTVSGKVKVGETLIETVKRELLEQ